MEQFVTGTNSFSTEEIEILKRFLNTTGAEASMLGRFLLETNKFLRGSFILLPLTGLLI